VKRRAEHVDAPVQWGTARFCAPLRSSGVAEVPYVTFFCPDRTMRVAVFASEALARAAFEMGSVRHKESDAT